VLSSSLVDWTVAHGTFQSDTFLTTIEPIRNRAAAGRCPVTDIKPGVTFPVSTALT
jgi:hypothetical protein